MKNLVNSCKCLLSKHKYLILYIIFIFYVVMTTFGVCVHETFYDEVQAWLVAQNLDFFELLKYMKYEGHLFLWYVLLMPFAKLNMPFPYSMQIINLVLMWASAFIVLKKAPFNPLINIAILFTIPFAYQYSVLARPYSLSILFLILLCVFYNDKLKHPILYSILIFLCANTSVMALFGALAFGLMFLYDYIKSKPLFYKTIEFWLISAIALFCSTIIAYQLLGAQEQAVVIGWFKETPGFIDFIKFVIFVISDAFLGAIKYNIWINGGLVILYIVMAISFLRKSYPALFFYLFTNIGLILFFFFLYNGNIQHHYFLFIYFFLSLWIYKLTVSDKKRGIYLFVYGFIYLLVLLCIETAYWYNFDIKYSYSNGEKIARYIANDESLKNSYIIICDALPYGVVPYLNKYGIDAYSCYDKKPATYFDYSQYDFMYVTPRLADDPQVMKNFEDKKVFLLTATAYYNFDKFSESFYKKKNRYCTEIAAHDLFQFCLFGIIPQTRKDSKL